MSDEQPQAPQVAPQVVDQVWEYTRVEAMKQNKETGFSESINLLLITIMTPVGTFALVNEPDSWLNIAEAIRREAMAAKTGFRVVDDFRPLGGT